MNNTGHKKITGMDFMVLSPTAFLGLCVDILLAYILEPMIWGCGMLEWSTGAYILHYMIMYVVWGGSAFWILHRSKKVCGFDPFAPTKKPAAWQWAATAVCIVICLVSTWIDCKGSKVLAEFRALGAVRFVLQYLYYLFEVMLVTLIIVFGQKAFEMWFQRPDIPYGAIVAAFTWGLAHWGTRSSLYAGLLVAAAGFCFGLIYLLLKRNIKLTYAALCIMFIL